MDFFSFKWFCLSDKDADPNPLLMSALLWRWLLVGHELFAISSQKLAVNNFEENAQERDTVWNHGCCFLCFVMQNTNRCILCVVCSLLLLCLHVPKAIGAGAKVDTTTWKVSCVWNVEFWSIQPSGALFSGTWCLWFYYMWMMKSVLSSYTGWASTGRKAFKRLFQKRSCFLLLRLGHSMYVCMENRVTICSVTYCFRMGSSKIGTTTSLQWQRKGWSQK